MPQELKTQTQNPSDFFIYSPSVFIAFVGKYSEIVFFYTQEIINGILL